MKRKLIITYSLTGNSKVILDNYPNDDIHQIATEINLPHSMIKAGYTISVKDLGSHYVQVPNYKLYDEVVIIVPVWIGKPAKVFTDVYQQMPFTNKKVTIYLSSLGFNIKPLKKLVDLLEPENEIKEMYIHGGKKQQKQLIAVDHAFNKLQ